MEARIRRQWPRRDPSDALFTITFLAIDVMAAFTQMLAAGMFERYPRLRCAVLEAGSNWIAAWERLAPLPEDARRKVLGQNAQRFYRLAG